MKMKLFPSPVSIRFDKSGLIHSVDTVEEAAKLLRDPFGRVRAESTFGLVWLQETLK
jgi:hypothetical protein